MNGIEHETRTELKVHHRAPWIATISGVLTPGECQALIDEAEGHAFDSAPITTAFGFVHAPDVRNNGRVMLDDATRASALWTRIAPHVPATIDGWRVVGLNERLRYYRYEPGQYFRWHRDGAFERNEREQSLLTCMLYLNHDGLLGGDTEFGDTAPVRPRAGKVLLFEHHALHQGAEVQAGVKYVLRTDVMYRY